MRKVLTVALVAILVSLLTPTTVKAEDCGSWICLGQIFGWTEVAKTNADADVKKAETDRLQQIEIARINAAKDQAMKNAEVDIERQRQAGAISVAQAQALAEQYEAKVNAWADIQKNAVNQQYETQRTALTQQTKLGVESIQQVGQTERWAIGWHAGLTGLGLLLFFIVAYSMSKARPQSQFAQPQIVYLVGQQPDQIGQSQRQIDAYPVRYRGDS